MCAREPVFGENRYTRPVYSSLRSITIETGGIGGPGGGVNYVTLQLSTKVLAEDKQKAYQIRVVPRWRIPLVPAEMQLTRGFLYIRKGDTPSITITRNVPF